jgi:hypothetical protein
MACIYLIEYKNSIIGAYNNYELAETFIASCMQHNFITDNINIVSYKTNTCFKLKTSTIEYFNDENINMEELQKNAQEAISKINKLELEEKKLLERVEKHNVNYSLYKKFKEKLNEDPDFIIPEYFLPTYKEFEDLDI